MYLNTNRGKNHILKCKTIFFYTLLFHCCLNHIPSLFHNITPKIPTHSLLPPDHPRWNAIFHQCRSGPLWRGGSPSVDRMWPLYFSVREGHLRYKSNHVVWGSHQWNVFRSQQALGRTSPNKSLIGQWHFLYPIGMLFLYLAVSNQTHL